MQLSCVQVSTAKQKQKQSSENGNLDVVIEPAILTPPSSPISHTGLASVDCIPVHVRMNLPLARQKIVADRKEPDSTTLLLCDYNTTYDIVLDTISKTK